MIFEGKPFKERFSLELPFQTFYRKGLVGTPRSTFIILIVKLLSDVANRRTLRTDGLRFYYRVALWESCQRKLTERALYLADFNLINSVNLFVFIIKNRLLGITFLRQFRRLSTQISRLLNSHNSTREAFF